jgi:hypothetical protein
MSTCGELVVYSIVQVLVFFISSEWSVRVIGHMSSKMSQLVVLSVRLKDLTMTNS